MTATSIDPAEAVLAAQSQDAHWQSKMERLRKRPRASVTLVFPDEYAAEEVNRIFGKQVYNWWQAWAVWGIISQPYVHGVQANKLPDGSQGIGLAFLGVHNMNQMWCDDGKCQ